MMRVEVVRGGFVESAHRVHAHVAHADGQTLFATSESFPFFARSAIKPFQAHFLLRSGAFRRFGLGMEHLALACASHAGQEIHTGAVAAWLGKLGLADADLACGPHWPYDDATSNHMKARQAVPRKLHNNCSGKHAGILTACRHLDLETRDYHLPGHPAQIALKSELERLLEAKLEDFGIDGCSLPAFLMEFHGVTTTFARLARVAKNDSTSEAALIFRAFGEHPVLTSGEGEYCARMMLANQGRFLVKEGAEGVLVGALPEKEIAILVKADDGAERAAQVAFDRLAVKFGGMNPVFDPRLANWAGLEVGMLRTRDV